MVTHCYVISYQYPGRKTLLNTFSNHSTDADDNIKQHRNIHNSVNLNNWT